MNLFKIPQAIKQRMELEQMLRPFVLANRQRDKANKVQRLFISLTKDLKKTEEVQQYLETALSPSELAKPANNRERLEALLNVRDLIQNIESPSQAQRDILALVKRKIEIVANKLDRETQQKPLVNLKEIDEIIAKAKRDNNLRDKAIKKAVKWEQRAEQRPKPTTTPLDQILQVKMTLMEASLADKEKHAAKAKEDLKTLLSHASTSLAKETVATNTKDVKIVIEAIQELRRLLDLADPETNRISQEIDELLLVLNQRYQKMLSPQSREREARQAKTSLNQLINPLRSTFAKPYIPEDIDELIVLIKYAKDLRDTLDQNDKEYVDLKWKTDCRISAWEFSLKNLLEQDQNV